jgi:DNA-binding beta-propeller fold protein YncE
MRRWLVMIMVLLGLAAGVLPEPAGAAVEWNRQQILKTEGAPLDIATTANGKYTFVLTDTGRVYIYSGQGKVEGTMDVGKNFKGIASSPTGDQIFLIDGATNIVQVFGVSFIQHINDEGAPAKGRAEAPVTIALFSDFQ